MMTTDLLLGIDLGTTALKAAVFDAATGRAVATAGVRLAVRTANDGTREQDLPAVDRAVKGVAAKLRSQLGRRWGRVAGLGLSAQGGSAIIADRRTGRALTPMQLWNDTRPLSLLAGIAAGRPLGYWQKLCYLDGPGAGLARMAWLRRRRGRLFTAANIYVGAGEYLYFKLTGVWQQDAGSALQQGAYDARHHRLSADPLTLVDVPLDFVAPMRQGHPLHPLGKTGAGLLGLPAGLPVAGPYLDHEAAYLGAALAAGGAGRTLQCSLGTAWVGSFVSPSGEPPSGGVNLVLPSPLGAGNLILRVMLAGTVTWDWALAQFGAGRRDHVAQPPSAVIRLPSPPEAGRAAEIGPRAGQFTPEAGVPHLGCAVLPDALSRADAIFRHSLLPPAGLVALPWLTRPNPFAPAESGAGAFFGINAQTTGADLLRATVAGMCCEFARVFEPIISSRERKLAGMSCPRASARGSERKLSTYSVPSSKVDIDRVILTGGASGGWYFRRLLAGLFAPLPVYHLVDDLAGARGTLYAFGARAPAGQPSRLVAIRDPGKATRVQPPSQALRQRIVQHYELFGQVCRKVTDGK